MSKREAARKRRRRIHPGRIAAFIVVVALLMTGAYSVGWQRGVESTRFTGSILLVNSENRLSADYVPEGLVNLYEQRHSFRLASSQIWMAYEAYEAMERMFAAAEADNVNGFIVTSGYRDYARQAEIYAETEAGKAQEPGASEHQTGLAFDVTTETSNGFESTPQYAWLMKNAHKYGFIQRYPANKSHITGISYEPWHYRYVGEDVASRIRSTGLTLEEFVDKYCE